MAVLVVMKEFIKSQLRTENFGFTSNDPNLFIKSRWFESVLAFVLYRTALAIWCVATLSYSFTLIPPSKWWIYITNWSYFLLTLSLIISAVNAWLTYAAQATSRPRSSENTDSLPTVMQVQWVFYNVAYSGAIGITFLYWVFDYNGQEISMNNINRHALNCVLITVDTIISQFPVVLLHFYMPVLYGICYSVWVWVFTANQMTNEKGEPFIYTILDFSENPEKAGIMLAVFVLVGVPLFHLVFFALYMLRETVYNKLYTRNLSSPVEKVTQSITSQQKTVTLSKSVSSTDGNLLDVNSETQSAPTQNRSTQISIA